PATARRRALAPARDLVERSSEGPAMLLSAQHAADAVHQKPAADRAGRCGRRRAEERAARRVGPGALVTAEHGVAHAVEEAARLARSRRAALQRVLELANVGIG